MTSGEVVQEFILQMAVEQRELRDDITSIQWHMRGSLSLNEAWSLSWDQRLDVKKLAKERYSFIKESGMPIL